jgi:DNA-binding response OmpR family regulator
MKRSLTKRATGTVLIVDDDATLRRSLESVLTPLGYRVLTAGSPDTAYSLLGAEAVDAVLLDIGLPEMSGLALYVSISHRWPGLSGHVAFITGSAERSDVRAWLAHNPSTVFRKPFGLDQVTDWLAGALQTPTTSAGSGRHRRRTA